MTNASGIDMDSIGQDRAIQNPHTAVTNASGVYKDAVYTTPLEKRLPILPQAPQPAPFVLRGAAKGK